MLSPLNLASILILFAFASAGAAQKTPTILPKIISATEYVSATEKAKTDARATFPRREIMFGDDDAKKYVIEWESAEKHRFFLTNTFKDGSKHRLDEITIGKKFYTGIDNKGWNCVELGFGSGAGGGSGEAPGRSYMRESGVLDGIDVVIFRMLIFANTNAGERVIETVTLDSSGKLLRWTGGTLEEVRDIRYEYVTIPPITAPPGVICKAH